MDAQDRVGTCTQEVACSRAQQGPESADGTWRKFAEPRGWALKWDGFALSENGERQDGWVLFPSVTSR